METFPAYVEIRHEGFSENRESALLRSDVESGPAKQARIKTAVLVTRPCQLRFLTKTDYLAFVAWYKTSINEGADWFTWPDPVSGLSVTARFADGGFKATPLAGTLGYWVIPVNIETWG